MKKIIIISGHGNYATGIQSSIELIAGKNKDIYYVDFTAEDTDLTLKEKMNCLLNENSSAEVLFICDIIGGTPFKVAAEIANYNDNMEVVVGCNLISMIEASFSKDALSIKELAEFTVDSCKKSIMVFKKVDINEVNNNLEIESGI